MPENFCGAFLLAALLPVSGLAFQPSDAAAVQLVEEGQKIFAGHCVACHGTEAAGTDMGPRLIGTRTMRSRSVAQLRAFIAQGNPSLGMPAFPLPARELDALATFLHSLNIPAAGSPLAGDARKGEEYFFGAGQCATCHTVGARGRAIGPDLSNVGREMTVGEIGQALRIPGARVTPGYALVSVRLRNGQTVRGFARGRTNFDFQLQGTDGQFRSLRQEEIAEIRNEQPLMKPVTLSDSAWQDLIAYLASLTGVAEGVSASVRGPAETGPDFARIVHPNPGDWLTYNGTLDGNRYSALRQINAANVKNLGVRWIFPVDHFGLEATPIVADGVMYFTGPNQAIALDALTGRQIWRYSRPRTPGLIGDASLGSNHGVAILGDKVFMATDNAHLLAINRITGRLVWDVYMPEEPQHYGSTVAPLIVGDTVVAGVSGGDRGIRGFLACYKAATGERLWRRWTIPGKGEPGAETWGTKEPSFGGGGTWLTGSFDPESDTLYWPTGNPWPDSDDRDRPGDNLYTNCILALDPHTGNLKWHYQFTPHDVHDWDATEPPLLVDIEYAGRARKLLLHADRNGLFYVLDRIEGKVLLAKPFARETWTAGIAPDGRPLPPSEESPLDCPLDAANWNSAAFSPTTRFFFVLADEGCRIRRGGNWKTAEQLEPERKLVRAIDIDSGKVAWEIPLAGSVFAKTWPGVLATAGGLVFYGDPNGAFAAADEKTGKTLWHFATNVYMKASPMTFSAGGEQFVAIAAGPDILCFGLH